MHRAVAALLAMGVKAVLLKGGHLEGPVVVDLLGTAAGVVRYESPKIDSRHTHGTGCTLASAVAAGLAQGMALPDAVARARAYVRAAILAAPGLGQGHGPLGAWRDDRPCAPGGSAVRTYPFVTVDVFTDRRFGGNQLAVFPDARGLSDAEMQSLAAEFNLSETTFVLPPADPANTARVRIFHRTAEMPFAGHPNVGTGYVLADRAVDGVLRFEEIAGLVEVRVERDAAGTLTGTTIAAPQALTLGGELPVAAGGGLCRDRPGGDPHRAPCPDPRGGWRQLAAAGRGDAGGDGRGGAGYRRLPPDGGGACRARRPALALPLPAGGGGAPGADVLAAERHLGGCGDRQRGDAAGRLPAAPERRGAPARSTSSRAWRWAARACCGPPRGAPRAASAPRSAAAACRCCGARPMLG